ncbi:MAG TPA: DUF4350 domain-containing protein [Terracidiphilus sp.]|jgi:hypothetical protein|nr:DUF4350 domain-containing protein [Terracidiphilus sp.]
MTTPTWFLPSLDSKDRKLLLWSLGAALVLATAAGVLANGGDDDDNRIPSSYMTGKHGALAAYETLVRSGYDVERWERPLAELAAEAGPQTVVIFAEPFTREQDDMKAVRQILERGGRVVATGYWGGYLLPGASAAPAQEFSFTACQLEPEGLDSLAGSGPVWMMPAASWQVGNPADRVQYSCAGRPAVVEYDWGKGHVVWWTSSTPLENGSLNRAQNLEFLLNSLGDRNGRRFYWDESLHGDIRSTWSYAAGPALNFLRIGVPVLAFLVLFSFSRRSGPVRELPAPVRATPIEFLEALGSLYQGAGAASTAVSVAWERFRRQALRLCGMQPQRMGAADVAAVVRRRFPGVDGTLEADLTLCEEAAENDELQPREALRLVRLLDDYLHALEAVGRRGTARPGVEESADAGRVVV